ncbi:MAG TPA: putative Ig domain-containing protein, partial [Solirubrobacteraceae bacterium]|nr:putative Ig domain-containing protein [Solirubrobacteraceae bacterium]
YDAVPVAATLAGDARDAAFCSHTDQRGVPRGEGPASGCSAGAFQYAPPVITAVGPRSSLELGLPVTLSGYGLGDLTAATLGSTAVAITAQSATAISFEVPLTLALGSRPIGLTNPDGSTAAPFDAVASPSIAVAALSPGQLKVPYSVPIAVAGGAAPFSFVQTGGALPAGLTLSGGGLVSGTPSRAGGTAFTVQVTDANGFSSSLDVSLAIATPVIALTTKPALRIAGTGAPVTVACSGAPCAGHVKLTGTASKKVHGRRADVTVILGEASYTAAVGQSATVQLVLTPAGLHAFKHARKHPLHETLSATVAAGTTASETVRVS